MSLHADKVVAAAETYMGLVNLVLGLFLAVEVRKMACASDLFHKKMLS
jgi:enoyl-CoA hydratase/carnithine racemase